MPANTDWMRKRKAIWSNRKGCGRHCPGGSNARLARVATRAAKIPTATLARLSPVRISQKPKKPAARTGEKVIALRPNKARPRSAEFDLERQTRSHRGSAGTPE